MSDIVSPLCIHKTSFTRGLITISAVVLGVVLSAQAPAPAPAPAQQKPYEPSVGQAGKDVVWVPTADALVAKMLDMAKLTPKDYLIDLGSGDGRTVIAAAKRGATAQGIEYNPDMVELSKKNAAAAGVAGKATFVKADIFETDYSKATVLTLFLLPDINLKLRPTILNMKPGTRVVSNSFHMEEWEAGRDRQGRARSARAGARRTCGSSRRRSRARGPPEGRSHADPEVPDGSGRWGRRRLRKGGCAAREITFKAGGAKYTGEVNGTSMTGTSRTGTSTPGGSWTATKR